VVVIEDCFAKCRSLLTEQRAALVLTLDEALATVERTTETLGEIDRAIAGMSPVEPVKRPKDKASTAKRKCSTKQEVLAMTQQVLREGGPLKLDALKEAVASRLRERGRSLSMFANLFESCLADPTLTSNEEGVYRLPSAGGWKTKELAAETLA
jgi:hypothetical protein